MDKAIAVGDLVMVVKPKICGCGKYGRVFRVEKICKAPVRGFCRDCKQITFSCGVEIVLIGESGAYETRRLKRIDPSATGDSLPTRRKIKEPA